MTERQPPLRPDTASHIARETRSGSSLDVRRFTLDEILHPDNFGRFVDAFQNAFGDSPWNRWRTCGNEACGQKIGKKAFEKLPDKIHCPHCTQEKLQPYYTEKAVKAKIEYPFSLPGVDAELFIAQETGVPNPQIAGFMWGYSDNLDALTRREYAHIPPDLPVNPLTSEKIDNISRRIKEELQAKELDPGRVAYMDMLGVVPAFRGSMASFSLIQGLSTSLSERARTAGTPYSTYFLEILKSPDDYIVMAGNGNNALGVIDEIRRSGLTIPDFIMQKGDQEPEFRSMIRKALMFRGSQAYPIHLMLGSQEILNLSVESGYKRPESRTSHLWGGL